MTLDVAKLTYKTINEEGEVIEVDMASGLPVKVEKKYILDSEVSPRHRLSPAIINIVCNMIREGKSFSEITTMSGMPPARVLYQWKRESEELRIGIEEAEKDRADIFHGRIISLASADLHLLSKEEIPAYKLQLDTLKYLAEVDDPDKYKAKPGAESLGSGSVVIKVDTGIQRETVETPVEVQFTEVQGGQSREVKEV
jgi:hypothetical protein